MNNLSYKQKILCTFLGILLVALFLIPLFWMVSTSIKPLNELFLNPPKLIPSKINLSPYIENFIKSQVMLKFIGNSFIITFGTVFLTLGLALPSAYALARMKIKGKNLILVTFLCAQMLPVIMLALPLFVLFSSIGLTNSYPALILANTTITLPFAVLVLRPFFLSIPNELEDAAMIDGCNKFTTFLKVILPLMKPGMFTVGAFCFLFAWGDLLFALTLTTTDSIRPVTLGLYTFVGRYGTEWHNLMAVATITTLPIIIIFILIQKHIMSGLTSGAIKG